MRDGGLITQRQNRVRLEAVDGRGPPRARFNPVKRVACLCRVDLQSDYGTVQFWQKTAVTVPALSFNVAL